MMIERLFTVADCHISFENEVQALRLSSLLKSKKSEFDAFVFLGDTFDFYFDFKNFIPESYAPVIDAMRDISETKVIAVVEGNHDMWYGDFFKELTRAAVAGGSLAMDVAGKRYLLNHGDSLCEKSAARRAADAVMKSSAARGAFSLLPPKTAYSIGKIVSRLTAGGKTRDKRREMAENAKSIEGYETAEAVILGHTHMDSFRQGKVVFLGDFASRGEYAAIDEKGVTFEHI